jgi:hypothetical protein
MEANSLRREQVKDHMRASGLDSPAAAQIAAHRTRDSKQLLSPEEVLRQHRELAAQHGNQADRVVAEARQHVQQHAYAPDKAAQVSWCSKAIAMERLISSSFARKDWLARATVNAVDRRASCNKPTLLASPAANTSCFSSSFSM